MANYGTVDIFGDPRAPGWERDNLVTLDAPGGQSWRVNRQAATAFAGLLEDLIAAGYNPTSSGGFNYRTIRGSDKLSQHAFGNAIDINAATNPMLQGRLQTDMPAGIGDIAARHGIEWGGSWKNRPDPMHFEWTGAASSAAGAAPQVAAPAGPAALFAPPSPMGPLMGLADKIEARRREDAARRAALFGAPAA